VVSTAVDLVAQGQLQAQTRAGRGLRRAPPAEVRHGEPAGLPGPGEQIRMLRRGVNTSRPSCTGSLTERNAWQAGARVRDCRAQRAVKRADGEGQDDEDAAEHDRDRPTEPASGARTVPSPLQRLGGTAAAPRGTRCCTGR